MDRTFSWVHVSDLHAALKEKSLPQDVVFTELIKCVNRHVKKHSLDVDALFATGDFVEAASKISFEEKAKATSSLLRKLRGACRVGSKSRLPSNRVFMVPGNHDIDKTKFGDQDKIAWSDAMRVLQEARENNDTDREDEAVAVLKRLHELHDPSVQSKKWHLNDGPLSQYNQFVSGVLGKKAYQRYYASDVCRQLACFSNIIRCSNGVRVRIDGYNTSWNCWGSSLLQRGQLHGAIATQYAALDSELPHSDNEVDLQIALFHHPPAWLVMQDVRFVETFMANRYQFLLHGHEHLSRSTFDLSRRYHKLSAGSAYSTDRAGDQADAFSDLRISVCECDLDNSMLNTWEYYYEKRGHTWEPVVNENTSQDGMLTVPLSQQAIQPHPRSSLASQSRNMAGLWDLKVKFENGRKWESCRAQLYRTARANSYCGRAIAKYKEYSVEFDIDLLEVRDSYRVRGFWTNSQEDNLNHGVFEGVISENSDQIHSRFLTSHTPKESPDRIVDGGEWIWTRVREAGVDNVENGIPEIEVLATRI